jgi:hypothetical protein
MDVAGPIAIKDFLAVFNGFIGGFFLGLYLLDRILRVRSSRKVRTFGPLLSRKLWITVSDKLIISGHTGQYGCPFRTVKGEVGIRTLGIPLSIDNYFIS